MREVANKERLIDRDILDRDNALAFFELDDPVNQQERIAMWNGIENRSNI